MKRYLVEKAHKADQIERTKGTGQKKAEKGKTWGKSRGNVGDIMTMGLCILGMTAVMGTYLDYMELIQQKTYVGQLARNYILRMETVGGLEQEDRIMLEQELADMGITEIDLTGTTFGETGYGERIALNIKGKLKGEYDFEECRVSTAKN